MTLLFLFAALGLATEATGRQNRAREPRIRYLYPAGGRQGTTFLVLVGGRQINRSGEVVVSGKGVRGRVVQDSLAMYVNDANERRVLHQLYADAFMKVEGESTRPGTPERKETVPPQKTATTPTPAAQEPLPKPEDVVKKYPYLHLLENPTARGLEYMYYFYFSPRLERRPPEEALNRGVMIEITIDPDAEPGDRDLRLLSPAGLTPPARFIVGIHPESREREPNNSDSEDPATANFRWQGKPLVPKSIKNRPPLELPFVMNGQIHTGDVDRFRFKAQRGQKLVIDVRARHLLPYLADGVPGWFQAAISLDGPNGRKIDQAMSYRHEPDPVLLVKIPETGVYALEIQDSIFRGRDDFVYRITVAESPLVTSVFPLGGQAGHAQEIELEGWNLPGKTILFEGHKGEHEITRLGRVRLPRPIRLAADELPEITEQEPNDMFEQAEAIRDPILVNGRISGEDDLDHFVFEGREGQRIVLDVTARSLGSPLDAMLELFDAAGKPVASNDDRADSKGPNIGLETHHADPYLDVKLPATGRYFVRIRDVARNGGPAFAYRLRVSAPQPDFSVFCEPSSLTFRGNVQELKVHLIRKDGFNGEVRLRLTDSKEFRIENGLIASGTEGSTVKLFALARHEGGVRELALEAVARVGGKEIVRPVIAVDDMEQAFIYHHWVPAQSLVTFKPKSKAKGK